jgi:3-oxoacyl-[acyl-carrier protein] reductase
MAGPQKIAVVTGAGGALGSAISIRLAQSGFDVVMWDLSKEPCQSVLEQVQNRGRRGLIIAADVTDEDAVREGFNAVLAQLGPPLVLVNNAGLMRSRRAQNLTSGDWDQVLAVNLRGAFLMCRSVIPFMKEARWGRIVSISSIGASGLAGSANYAAAKAGIEGLSGSLAKELGAFNITANAVAPGFIATNMTAEIARARGVDIAELEREMTEHVPLGRAGTPADVANAVAFFVSEESAYISGAVLKVAGGS